MTSLWDDIAKTIREGVDTVVEKTEEYTRIGRIKVDILNIKRNVEKNFAELGGKVYHLIVEEKKTQVANNKEVKEIVECVKLLEKELEEKNKELEKVKAKEGKREPEATKTGSKKSASGSSKSKASKSTGSSGRKGAGGSSKSKGTSGK